MDFKELTSSIQKLPGWAKLALAAGLGAAVVSYIYTSKPHPEETPTEYWYPEVTDPGVSGGGGGSAGLNEQMSNELESGLTAIANNLNSGINDLEERQSQLESQVYSSFDNIYEVILSNIGNLGSSSLTGPINAGDMAQPSTGTPGENTATYLSKVTESNVYKEGNITYEKSGTSVLKNGKPVAEKNMRYIPKEVGGTRDTTYKEGGITYENKGGTIYKNGRAISEKDYKYIPKEVGGLRN